MLFIFNSMHFRNYARAWTTELKKIVQDFRIIIIAVPVPAPAPQTCLISPCRIPRKLPDREKEKKKEHF
jgi:hypothetical protein